MPRKHGTIGFWTRSRKRRKRTGQKKRSLAARRGENLDKAA